MYNEKTELDVSNISGLDESLLDNYSNADADVYKKAIREVSIKKDTIDLGNGFYSVRGILNVRYPRLFKKYIDGTTQDGLLIDVTTNKIKYPLENNPLLNQDYPKDKGFVQGDGAGEYFYFPELPEFIRTRIAELEKLKKDADDAAAAKLAAENKSAAEREAARKKEEEAKRAFELKKAESERKAKEEERKAKEAEAKRVAAEKQAETKIAEQKRLAGETESQTRLRLAETEAKAREAEAKAKTKKAMIIGGSVLALVAGFFIWKKFK